MKNPLFLLSLFIFLPLLIQADEVSKDKEEARLVYLAAGHVRKSFPDNCETCTVYTVTAKSNQLTVKLYEKLMNGHISKKFSRISKEEIKIRKPYIVPECLASGHKYLYAGDIYNHKAYYFEGIIVGIPEDPAIYNNSVYVCSIMRNNGKASIFEKPDLGPFELGYNIIRGLEIYNLDAETVKNLVN
ncbi:MAG: hypothetical protein HRT44_09850 [Bdellovibrionales bacterium]|nr:hypothetical protein [Bdellovibrionales bacterium]NQZ19542.1 hypothetical protein [Bdellovibrionales bacterium]